MSWSSFSPWRHAGLAHAFVAVDHRQESHVVVSLRRGRRALDRTTTDWPTSPRQTLPTGTAPARPLRGRSRARSRTGAAGRAPSAPRRASSRPSAGASRGEDAALEQELVVALEGVERLVERGGQRLDVRPLLGRPGEDVLVEGAEAERGRVDAAPTPSIPAMSWAAIARYGLQVASGGRNSIRAVSGRFAYLGIRMAALRLPSEKMALTGAS